MVSVFNIVALMTLLVFGVGFFLFGLGAPLNSLDIFAGGMVWALFVSLTWTLAMYTLHLDQVGSRARNGFMRNSWILSLIGMLLSFVGILVLLFSGGMTSVAMGGASAGVSAGLIMIAIGPIMSIFLPALAKMIAREEIGLPAIGLVAEIFGLIFSVMLLISLILLVANSYDGFKWVNLITGICGLAFGVLWSVSLFLYKYAPVPARR